ncbi:HLA class II histocompatibility antigen, DP beta 1 chain [Fukomys damarensis]|uniref:HLA class II histocompatibility antigen, DP beta 1 chain n=1 Tax=Fukomys damarensis TaxID=885580 RepID=A0A091DJZ6_FUKDA|nr:HLA class II histocompatibility antigen, DP beta 1 chain [Fukomys damarensis]
MVLRVPEAPWIAALAVALVLSNTEVQSRTSPVQPQVHVSPSKKEALQHYYLLICHVRDFYPGNIRVRWILNGQERTAGVVSTSLMRSGAGPSRSS